jgi:uncharacterized repeat protein (TIGR02543 family)
MVSTHEDKEKNMKRSTNSEVSKFTYLIALTFVSSLLLSLIPAAVGADVTSNAGTCVVTQVQLKPEGTVYFANASAKLDSKSKKILDGIIAKVAPGKVVKLQVTGFVSAAGSPKKYKALSNARAVNVEKYFLARGLKVEFVTKGVGLSPSQSSAAKARKVTIEAVSETDVPTGGTVPKVNSLLSIPASFEAGKPVTIKVAELDVTTPSDPTNPTTLSISPALPEGLTFDPVTGVISGTAKNKSDSTIYVVTASNKCGTATTRVEAVVAPTAVVISGGGGGGGGPAPLLVRTISIDPASYRPIYFDLLDEEHTAGQLADALLEFNGVTVDGIPHDGIHVTHPGEPDTLIVSPTLTSTPDPSSSGGTKRYYVSDYTNTVCTVNETTGKVIFLDAGNCSVYVTISSDGTYESATSAEISILLAGTCASLDPLTNPTFVSDGSLSVTSGTYYEECAVASSYLAAWGYAKGAATVSDVSDYAFVGAPADNISKSAFCTPRDVTNGAFPALNYPAGSVKLADWKYVWGYVSVEFTDGSIHQYLADNYDATQAEAFNNCYAVNFDANGGNFALDAITSVNAFVGEYVTAPSVSKDGYTFAGWSATLGGSLVTPVGTAETTTYFAKWSDQSFTLTSSADTNGTITATDTVASGGSKTFTITPNEGYVVQDVLVDGVSVGDVSTYEFTNVLANHTISVTFVLAADTTAPVLTLGSASNIVGVTADMNFTSSETGTYYVWVLLPTDPVPTATEVLAAYAIPGSGLGNGSAIAGINVGGIINLTPGASYISYVLVVDAAGNNSNILAIEFTAAAAGG